MAKDTKLSEYFKRSEFVCHCGCKADTVDAELLSKLDRLRKHFSSPVVVISGFRCPKHNKRIGGATQSQHLNGKAAHIRVKGVPPEAVADYLESRYLKKYGIGRYNLFTHFDVRSEKARWDKTS